jgi:hypothetical protein
MSSVIHQQSAIEEMLQAINLLLHSSPAPTISIGGNPIGSGEADLGHFGEYCATSDLCEDSWTPENKRSPSIFVDAPEHGSLARGNLKQACQVPYWEQQAPYNTMTLPDVFKLLESEDDNCIICVKKIHKLGFRSVKFLRQYFCQFGQIARIIVLPSRQKESGTAGYYGANAGSTVRPASMCFMVTANRWVACRVLDQAVHMVGDWPVEVSRFDRKASQSTHQRTPSISSIGTATSY